MKPYRALTVAFLACFVAVAAVLAADASPAGTWKWATGRGGEVKLKLELAGGKLRGTLLAPPGGQFPDTPISDAAFENGTVKFSVTREAGGVKVTTKYEGRLEGDAIKGTLQRPNLQGGGEPVKREWTAQRVP